MTSRDIYVSRLLFANDHEALAREFANATTKNEISSRHWDNVLGPLRFVFVPKDARALYSLVTLNTLYALRALYAYAAFYNRNMHHAAIDLLNGLLFKVEVTHWRFGDNGPRRADEVPSGVQYNAIALDEIWRTYSASSAVKPASKSSSARALVSKRRSTRPRRGDPRSRAQSTVNKS